MIKLTKKRKSPLRPRPPKPQGVIFLLMILCSCGLEAEKIPQKAYIVHPHHDIRYYDGQKTESGEIIYPELDKYLKQDINAANPITTRWKRLIDWDDETRKRVAKIINQDLREAYLEDSTWRANRKGGGYVK